MYFKLSSLINNHNFNKNYFNNEQFHFRKVYRT